MNKKNTILIIANGTSVLEHDFGQTIDQYPTIARINNYKISGYEKNIGSKTDIWFNGANSKLRARGKNPKKVVVLIPSSILLKKEKNLNQYIYKRLKINEDNFNVVNVNDIKNFENHVGADRLTTGLYSILWALKNFNEVIIHGFDFFINTKGHYYNSKITELINTYILNKGSKHSNELELEYVNKLLKNNVIKSLFDLKKEIG